jgi:hypothetical protein
MTAPTTRPTRTRLDHLDRLKVLLVGLIIVAHGILGYCGVGDVGVLAVATFLMRLVFPFQSGEWAHLNLWEWPQYVALFGLGTVAARRGGPQPVPDGVRRCCGIGALAATGGVVFLFALGEALHVPLDAFGSGWRWPSALLCLVEATLAVCASVWLLAAAQRWLDRPMGRGWRASSRAGYAAFVVQGPVLVALALALRPVAAPAEARAVVVAGLGLVVSFALGLLLLRLHPVRNVLGHPA